MPAKGEGNPGRWQICSATRLAREGRGLAQQAPLPHRQTHRLSCQSFRSGLHQKGEILQSLFGKYLSEMLFRKINGFQK